MKANFKFIFVFDFDDAISAINYDDFVVSKLAEKGIDVSLPVFQKDGEYIAIYKDKISDK